MQTTWCPGTMNFMQVVRGRLPSGGPTSRYKLRICISRSARVFHLPKPATTPKTMRATPKSSWSISTRRKYPVVLPEYREQTGSVNSYHLIDVLSDVLTPNDIVVTDMGFAFQNTHQAFRVKKG